MELLGLIFGWFALMRRSLVALASCPSRYSDDRTQCHPAQLKSVLSPEAAAGLIAAAEAAQGWTSSREHRFPTADLALERVASNSSDAAVSLVAAGLVAKCGARTPVLTAGYVLKYEGKGMPQHADEEGRYGAVVSLNAPSESGGFRAPADLLKYRAPKVKRSKRDEYDHRKAMGHKSWEPHFQYDDLCPQTCAGLSCDEMMRDHTLDQLSKWACDCTFCADAMPPLRQSNNMSSFEGGGTRFSAARDVVFQGDVGDAVLYGAHVRHGAEPVTHGGKRFVLALFFDDGRCASAVEDWDTFVCSLGVFALVAILAAIFLADFDTSAETKLLLVKKKAK